MRVQALLIIAALTVVAGCQAGPSTAAGSTTITTTSKRPVPTTTPPPRTTAKPDASTPHQTVRLRLFAADTNHNSVLILEPHGPNPARDLQTAKQVRQNPALTTDKDAQKRAADSLDCDHDDPPAGQDDPNLPLVTCTGSHDAAVLEPTLLDASMIAGASYGLSTLPSGGWVVEIALTPAGRDIVTEMAPKNVNVLLAILLDGQLVTWLFVSDKLAGALDFLRGTEEDARQLAAVINNR